MTENIKVCYGTLSKDIQLSGKGKKVITEHSFKLLLLNCDINIISG